MSSQGAAIMVEPGTTSDALTAICERVQWRATAIEIQPLSSVCAASVFSEVLPSTPLRVSALWVRAVAAASPTRRRPRRTKSNSNSRSTPNHEVKMEQRVGVVQQCPPCCHCGSLPTCGVERWHHQRRVRCCTHGQPRRSPATPRGSSAQATACLWWALPAIGAPAQTQRVVVKPRLRGCGHGHRGSTT